MNELTTGVLPAARGAVRGPSPCRVTATASAAVADIVTKAR